MLGWRRETAIYLSRVGWPDAGHRALPRHDSHRHTVAPMPSARNSSRNSPVVLVVLDGWGHRPVREGNAIGLGATPIWHRLWERGSRTLLEASGLRVGLPEGQMGNSEVGHLNLGAGRVVMQDLVRISQSIKDRSFFANPSLVGAARRVREAGGTLHHMGLI